MIADSLHSFLIEGTRVRGRVLQLHEVWREVLRRGRYPGTEAAVLGQALAATGLLSAALKGEGRLTLQLRGNGPLSLMVTQFVAPDGLRGMVHADEPVVDAPLSQLFGDAQLALTLEPPNARERYQGLVDLSGHDLAAALGDYFERSEQLPTRFWLAVDEQTAAGLMLQQLPGEDSGDPDAWERSLHLASTLGADELLQTEPMLLLRRLFAGETLRVFEPRPLRFSCGCSRERSETMLRGLGVAEVEDILREQGSIEVRCEFCNARYLFDAEDVGLLLGSMLRTH